MIPSSLYAQLYMPICKIVHEFWYLSITGHERCTCSPKRWCKRDPMGYFYPFPQRCWETWVVSASNNWEDQPRHQVRVYSTTPPSLHRAWQVPQGSRTVCVPCLSHDFIQKLTMSQLSRTGWTQCYQVNLIRHMVRHLIWWKYDWGQQWACWLIQEWNAPSGTFIHSYLHPSLMYPEPSVESQYCAAHLQGVNGNTLSLGRGHFPQVKRSRMQRSTVSPR